MGVGVAVGVGVGVGVGVDRIVPVPCDRVMVALIGLLRLTKNVLSGAMVVLPLTSTATPFAVCPGE